MATTGSLVNNAEVDRVRPGRPRLDAQQQQPGRGRRRDRDVQADAQTADLSLTKTVDDPTPTICETVAFTVTVANAGPDTATGVMVTDLLPAGLAFVTAKTSQGSTPGRPGIWRRRHAHRDSNRATLVIRARVTTPAASSTTPR